MKVQDEVEALIHEIVDYVDACIIDDIRRGSANRDALLAELDVLEKVRERLSVRLIRAS